VIRRNNISKVRDILRIIKSSDTFFITSHLNPDGDTVGSELALLSWLKRLGKKVVVANLDPIPEIYHFLPGINAVHTKNKVTGNYDIGFILECSEPERMGNIIDFKKQLNKVINIDHHVSTITYGDINWFNSKFSATAEQIYLLIKNSKMMLTKEEAVCLYVGLLTDTGKFQQQNTTSETHRIVAELLKYAIHPEDIYQKIYATKSFFSLKLLGLALSSLRLVANGKIAYQEITRKMYEQAGLPEDDEEIINYPLSIPQVKVSILFREMRNNYGKVKIGFRTRSKVNVYQIAEYFGGGGHLNASGCILEGNLDTVKKRIINYVKKFI